VRRACRECAACRALRGRWVPLAGTTARRVRRGRGEPRERRAHKARRGQLGPLAHKARRGQLGPRAHLGQQAEQRVTQALQGPQGLRASPAQEQLARQGLLAQREQAHKARLAPRV
jgi:hypothetical protein